MRARRLISLVILSTLLTSTISCSGTRTIPIDSNPASSSSAARLDSGERVEISGYTLAEDGFRDWEGFVTSAPPDSLSFVPKPETSAPLVSFRLARTDVLSIDASTSSNGRTALLIVASVVVVVAVVTAVAIHNNWNPIEVDSGNF